MERRKEGKGEKRKAKIFITCQRYPLAVSMFGVWGVGVDLKLMEGNGWGERGLIDGIGA